MEAEIVNVYGKKLLDLPYIPTTLAEPGGCKTRINTQKLLGKISQQTLKVILRAGW